MLGKLFKHDMRQIAKIMFPFMLLVFGTTILGTAALKCAREASHNFHAGLISGLFNVSLYLLFAFSVFALLAYAVLAVFLPVSRYYKHLFTDEGYLTFTLPVKTSTLIFSKLWAALIWTVVSIVVVLVCILLYVTFGGAPIGKVVNTGFYEALKTVVWPGLKLFFTEIDASSKWMVVEFIASELVAIVYGILLMFLAITIGSIIAKKHKILASIGIYYLINTAISTATTIMIMVLSFGTVSMFEPYADQSADPFVHVMLIGMLFLHTGIMIAEFLVTNHLLKKKLNLQ